MYIWMIWIYIYIQIHIIFLVLFIIKVMARMRMSITHMNFKGTNKENNNHQVCMTSTFMRIICAYSDSYPNQIYIPTHHSLPPLPSFPRRWWPLGPGRPPRPLCQRPQAQGRRWWLEAPAASPTPLQASWIPLQWDDYPGKEYCVEYFLYFACDLLRPICRV